MKPKFRTFALRGLPLVIIVAASSWSPVAAAIVDVTADGSLVIDTTFNNSSTSFTATGGDGTNKVLTVTALNINGDAAAPNNGSVISVSVAGYTINNNGGYIDAETNGWGIFGDPTVGTTVNNSGAILGSSGTGALSLGSGSTVFNQNLIIGYTDGILINGTGSFDNTAAGRIYGANLANGGTGDGVEVTGTLQLSTNEGLIIGVRGVVIGGGGDLLNTGSITGFAGFGVQTGDLFSFINNGVGTVTGSSSGVSLGGNSTVQVGGGVIQGTADYGVVLGASSLVNNSGSITGGTDGVRFNGIGGEVSNDGTITGTSGFGVVGQSGLDVRNYLGGTITGANGVELVNGTGTIVNFETISGTNGFGISSGGTLDIENHGDILAAPGFRAIVLGLGDDVVKLYDGSFVNNGISPGGGYNILRLFGGLTSLSDTTNNVIGGPVAMQEVFKTSPGTAFIGTSLGDADQSFMDTVTIELGGLYINGDLDGLNLAQTSITADGTALGGTGTWNANITINGGGFSPGLVPINLDVNPENSVGQVTLTGPVSHTAASTFIRWDVIPDSPINNGVNSDTIFQTGVGSTYDLGGAGLRMSLTDPNAALTEGSYLVVDSQSAILGSVGALSVQMNLNTPDTGHLSEAWLALLAANADNPLTTTLNVTNTVLTQYFTTATVIDTDLVLDVDYDFAGLPGLSENQVALAGAIDAALTGNDPDALDYATSLSLSSYDSVVDALGAELSPLAQAISSAGVLVNSNNRLHRQIQDRNAQLRPHTDGVVSVPVGTSSKGGMSPASPKRGNVWGTFSCDWQEYDNGAGNDIDGETGAFTAGVDYLVAPNLILGGLLDGSRGEFDDAPDVESFRAAFYGTWGAPTGLYSDFLIGLGTHDIDVTDATSFQALATIGYTIASGGVNHGPYAGLEYNYIDVDGFNEGLIESDDFDVQSFRGLIGYRVNAQVGRFQPYASISYAHEFDGDQSDVNAEIFGAGFDFRGAEQGSAVLITLGTGITLTGDLSLSIGYRGEITTEDEGTDSHGGSLGLNYRF